MFGGCLIEGLVMWVKKIFEVGIKVGLNEMLKLVEF